MSRVVSLLLGAALLCGHGVFCRRVVSGQKVCFTDYKHPCYKMAYFHELSSRVSFQEARLACESEGGALLSLENEVEQKLIESMLQNLTKPGTGISDGDFWIGLWRNGEGQASGACPDLYQWSDGSSSHYRNWYTDEPSCGSEKCVVMYHQPTANPGLGGPYLYQWNDDRCNMKHNYICKYEPVKEEQKLAQTSPHCGFQKAREKKVAWKYKKLLSCLQKRNQSFVIWIYIRNGITTIAWNGLKSQRICKVNCKRPLEANIKMSFLCLFHLQNMLC
ncbi:chondrolectin isoform X1 [Saccopteryx bilineata]|uniref:chondrolectin isoform X1 n=1 Tax=Saccopteryx bilineata TaxID=59482 RepID=UPI00338E05F3